jgi:hypothetical protein
MDLGWEAVLPGVRMSPSPPPSPTRRLCRNYDGGWAHAGKAVRFLSFRMRVFYSYRSSVFRETKSFRRLVSLWLICKRFPL